jgi:hypothetical protein
MYKFAIHFRQLGFDVERLIGFTFGLDNAFTSLQFIWQLGFDLERLIGIIFQLKYVSTSLQFNQQLGFILETLIEERFHATCICVHKFVAYLATWF